jgi:glyoxylase I family protein
MKGMALETVTNAIRIKRRAVAPPPAFGQVSIGGLKLILSGRGALGSRTMPDGRQQEPGGWNRMVLQVKDLPVNIADLKDAPVRFRNEMEVGPGGKQTQIEDPDGNPIELPGRH